MFIKDGSCNNNVTDPNGHGTHVTSIIAWSNSLTETMSVNKWVDQE
jgi:subtilisin family serine protease